MTTQEEIELQHDGEKDSISVNGSPHNYSQPYRTSVIVIGGGQSGLAVGYYLKKQNIPFVILDAHQRIGDAWRSRWDSLKLFTPARYDGLPGMRYPAPIHYFPTKDEMADFLEHYAKTFDLPVRNGVRVEKLSMENSHYLIQSDKEYFEADNVVIAMANYQQPRVPSFSNELDPAIVQFHSRVYRNPDQLQEGDVLLVGAGNSASELAMELSKTHKVYMSGRDTGVVPFRIETKMAKFFFLPLVLKVIFHRILTINTPIGRKVRAKILTIGGALIRVKPKDLAAAGVSRVPKTIGIRNGLPLLENEKVLDVKNVIWCTGFHPGFSWIKLPVLGEHEPKHHGGIVPTQPGLYFMGLHFLYSFSSTMIQGADRDAKRIVNHLVARMKAVV